MRVCIDVQSAIAQRAGVGRYTRELVENLGAMAGEDELRLFYFDFMRKGMPFSAPNATHGSVRWCPGRLAQAAWKTISWPPFDFFAGNADVYHFPNFILPPLSQGKSVVTIHDLSFMRFPQFAEEKNLRYLKAKIRDTVNRADAIITDSKFGASEIESLLKTDPSKIHPIHLGISGDFKPIPREVVKATLAGFGIDRPYILSIGTIEPRKNIPFLVEVFEKLSSFDGYLVLAGMPGWKFEPILKRIAASPCASRIKHLSYVADSDLPALYSGAQVLALTSLYEGFGFPPLEAMACGTPVVSSPCGSLGEVLGGAAQVVEQFEPDLWAVQISKTLSDSELRRRLTADGTKRAAGFTWRETARKTWDVYRKLRN
jgi:glycosyltransferase involved in cell wall biosynthesis